VTDWIQAAAEEISQLEFRDWNRENFAAIIRRHHEASKCPALRRALDRYGTHGWFCREDRAASGQLGLPLKCTCGLDAALEEVTT